MRLVFPVVIAAACVHAPPLKPPPVLRPAPPFAQMCQPQFVRCDRTGPHELADGTTVHLALTTHGRVGPHGETAEAAAGYAAVARDLDSGAVISAPMVDREPGAATRYEQFHLFASDLELPPGEYVVEVAGHGLRMLQLHARVARIKMLDGSTKIAAFLHRGTRVWLAEGTLTVGRFHALDENDPVRIEWERDGVIVAHEDGVRGRRFTGEAAELAGTTPWRYGESYKLPADLAQQPGHWLARIHTVRDTVEIAFDIHNGALAIGDASAQALQGPAMVSPPLYVRAVGQRAEVVAELEHRRRAESIAAPSLGRDDFASPVTFTPELVRAATRDPALAPMLQELASIRSPHGYGSVGEIARGCAGSCPELSPEQAWRQRKRFERASERDHAAIERRNRARAPKLRAKIVARIAERGARPFATNEVPR